MSGASITPFPRARIVRLAPTRQDTQRLVPEPKPASTEPKPVTVILAESENEPDELLVRERRRLVGRHVLCLVTGWRGYVTECRRRLGMLEAKFWTHATLGAPQRAQWVEAKRLAPHPRGAA